MAKWVATDKNFAFKSKTAGDKQIKAAFDLETGVGHFEQDISNFKEQAKVDRDYQDYYGHRKDGYRKFATIPDAVALKILENHGLDIHHPEFMSNPADMAKLKRIVMTEYKDLIVNT